MFTIADVYRRQSGEQGDARRSFNQFVVNADVTAGGRRGDAHHLAADHHVGRVPDRGAAPRRQCRDHRASARHRPAYRQNMVFHKNAFALVMVPMVKPPGAVDVRAQVATRASRFAYPLLRRHQRHSHWRLDVLYGVKAIDPRLAARLSGTA